MAWRSNAVKEIIVYASSSTNVFSNLGFEDWIFNNIDLSYRRILYLWRNTPSNPWMECNVSLLRERGVDMVRRRSGGGTVYHDLGNLNVTVFAHRTDYDRPRNLQLVTTALNKRWNTQLHVNECNDIMCRDRWKVSGSSSKLGKHSTYHHFTLLLEADLTNLHQYISPHPELVMKSSSATRSRRSEVANLCSLFPSLSHQTVASAIADEFYAVNGLTGKTQIITVDPTSEDKLTGIADLTNELKKWEWRYGKTPKFTSTASGKLSFGRLDVELEVNRGKIEQCTFGSGQREMEDMFYKLQHSLKDAHLGKGCLRSKLYKTNIANDSRAVEIVNWLDEIF